MDRLKTAALAAALAALASPAFAGWTIVKNAPDPFDPAKSTFIAMTGQDQEGFASLRCSSRLFTWPRARFRSPTGAALHALRRAPPRLRVNLPLLAVL